MPLDDVRRAHELMESGTHTGKILLVTLLTRRPLDYRGPMSEQQPTGSGSRRTAAGGGERQVVIVGPDGQPIGSVPESALARRPQGGGDGLRRARRSPTWSSSPPR